MKYLLLLVLGWVAVLVWRSKRRAPPPCKPAAPHQSPQPMVSCRVCGTHLPRAEAIASSQGYYCCQAHEQQDD